MIFINDIDLNELYNQEKLEIILVDHHSLKSKLNDIVIEIIDHHQIEKDSIKLQE
jgi:inorganic pyrophosphatase/exopolyphosphatase